MRTQQQDNYSRICKLSFLSNGVKHLRVKNRYFVYKYGLSNFKAGQAEKIYFTLLNYDLALSKSEIHVKICTPPWIFIMRNVVCVQVLGSNLRCSAQHTLGDSILAMNCFGRTTVSSSSNHHFKPKTSIYFRHRLYLPIGGCQYSLWLATRRCRYGKFKRFCKHLFLLSFNIRFR